MIRRWIPAVAALALLPGMAGAARTGVFLFVPVGLGNPVFGYGPGFGGWGGYGGYGGWGFYPGGMFGGYYPRAYGAFPNYGYGSGPAYGGYGGYGMNPYYSGMYPGMAPAGISYVAFAGRGSSSTVPVTVSTPDLPAVVEVEVPAGAQLWFDGQPTTQKGSQRTFHTPALEKGQSYHYDVRARWTQDGTPVDQTQRVDVYAGGQVKVVFPKAK
jgi:uncharacterized protein (TIGR03000 family)